VTQPKTPKGGERRVVHRYRAKETARGSCRECAGGAGPDLALSLLDLSEEGAGLLLSEPLGCGQLVLVGLQAAEWAEEVRVPGMIVWAIDDHAGRWRTGVLFSRPLGLAALRDLCQLPGP